MFGRAGRRAKNQSKKPHIYKKPKQSPTHKQTNNSIQINLTRKWCTFHKLFEVSHKIHLLWIHPGTPSQPLRVGLNDLKDLFERNDAMILFSDNISIMKRFSAQICYVPLMQITWWKVSRKLPGKIKSIHSSHFLEVPHASISEVFILARSALVQITSMSEGFPDAQ